jgi:hypothetical protein
MEKAMFTRVAVAGVTLLACSLIAVAGAGAQTATAPGQPIDLLRVLNQPDPAKPRIFHGHKKLSRKLSRTSHKTHLAALRPKRHHHLAHIVHHAPTVAAVTPTPAPPPAPAWSDTPPVPKADASAAATTPMPVPTALASATPAPSELVVGGQTVQVVSPDGANDMDLAADTAKAPATAEADDVVSTAEPAEQSVHAAQAPKSSTPVGSATWIAQVLAALGGAVAAGSVAWFLIGYAPQRSYG